MTRRIAVLVTATIGAVCAAYTVIYLVRWEWNRALLAAAFFLAVEILLVGALVVDRLRRLEDRIDSLREAGDPSTDVLDAVRGAAPDPPDRFGWIRDQAGRTNVFLPVLLGAGVVVSAVAWVIEHLARAFVTPSLERRLALRLGAITAPASGLLAPPVPRPTAARPRRWTNWLGALVLVVVASIATAGALDFVADRTQSRPTPAPDAAHTVVDVQLRGELASRNPERMIGHLWATCTAPGVLPGRPLPDPVMEHAPGPRVRIIVDAAMTDNHVDRLRGCLNDVTIDRVQASVVDITRT